MENKKIAIIGSGISGLSMAYIARQNGLEVTLYEQNDYFGGHSNTIDLEINNKIIPVDTGFLVHNKITYPNLIQLFDLLQVEIVDSDMSLSIKIEDKNLEWGGADLDSVFAQRSNLLNPSFYLFLKEILKFNKNAGQYLEWAQMDTSRTLGDLLAHFKYSERIKNWYLIPIAAAIWSTPADLILNFPAHTFLTFSLNHHLLQVNDRPTWRTIKNGSRNYVKKITDLISQKYLNEKVLSVEKSGEKIKVQSTNHNKEFDYVVMASHAPQTLKMLKNTDDKIKKILSSFQYEKNIAVVHSDENFLPKRIKIWSAWNYNSAPNSKKVSVSYFINKLQPLETTIPIIVTLNPHKEVAPSKIYRTIEYQHPLFDHAAILAQEQIETIQGIDNIFFAGAWGGYGFHEDGIKSAVKAAIKMGLNIPWNYKL